MFSLKMLTGNSPLSSAAQFLGKVVAGLGPSHGVGDNSEVQPDELERLGLLGVSVCKMPPPSLEDLIRGPVSTCLAMLPQPVLG